MVIGKKFWTIKTTAVDLSYDPADQSGINFGGALNGTTTITTDAATVTAINALLGSSTNGVGIAGQWIPAGTKVTVAAGTSLTLSQPTINTVASGANLTYWDLDYPSVVSGDQPINAILCLASSKIEFYDRLGKLVSIPAGKLVVGAVYYFEIKTVKTATGGDYIGFASA